MSAMWSPRRRPALLPAAVVLLVCVLMLVGAMGAVALLAYTAGYTTGTRNSYAQGRTDGQLTTCIALADQVRWARNIESDLLKSGRDSQTMALKVQALTDASLHYTCAVDGSPSMYDPSVRASTSLPLASATLPLGARAKPLKAIR